MFTGSIQSSPDTLKSIQRSAIPSLCVNTVQENAQLYTEAASPPNCLQNNL